MAYRLKHSESLSHGVRRVYGEEISWAIGQLSGSKKDSTAIHEARKSIKKIRGLLSLLSEKLGPQQKQEDRYFRQAARALSNIRDNDVIPETFDEIVKRHPEEDDRVVADIRARLQLNRRRASDSTVKLNVAKHLEAARGRADDWPLGDLTFEEILPAIENSYRRGRKALAKTRKSEAPEDFHELRKNAKEHWYHLRLLESEGLKKHLAALHGIESALGDEHNLTILRERLEKESETMRDRQQFRQILYWLTEDAKGLRDEAVRAAEQIYGQKPGHYAEWLTQVWTPPTPKQPPSQVLRAQSAVA